ncbi:AraC family transcriptional regulator [Maribellus luteus]|uniref:AraC family transcriptional regulator n=1 Tax=Maribellus luteus TaxID=2305463 RepID=A0A399T2U4_9BACT|nr:AraC family transcriptional regulator [Maribellus luteus]RIJ49082.1 AraC family transcriptional regulator [Maribellus luteus]
MSNLADRRDKPEIEQFRDIHLSELCSLLKLYESQELVCLFNRADGKIICMVDAAASEGILDGKGGSFNNLIEVDKPALQNVWTDLQRLRKESKVKPNGRRSTGRQVMLVFDTMLESMKKEEVSDFRMTLKDFYSRILSLVGTFNGKVLNSGSERFYVVFEFADEALQCSVLLKERFYALLNKKLHSKVFLRMGLSTVAKVSSGNGESKSATRRSERLCHVAREKVLLSSDFRELTQSEGSWIEIDAAVFDVLSAEDEQFVNMLLDCVEKKWQDESFLVDDFSKQLSWSKSQIYRKMIALLGLSPNNFIREYRLGKSIDLLNQQESNIAEIAFESGFSSPSYFTKCFQVRFGITPSDYLQIVNSEFSK